MMNKLIYILIFFVVSINLSAQIEITDSSGTKLSYSPKSKVEIGDIDNDGIQDSLYYNFQTDSIIYLLSGKKFTPRSIPYLPEGYMARIEVDENALHIYESHMRTFNIYSYYYDNEKCDFRLASYASETFGNAANDGSGSYSLDLLSGEFSADWNYYDIELDSLISIPTINEVILNPPIYINEPISVDLPSDSIFSCSKKSHMVESRIKNLSKKNILNIKNKIPSKLENTDISSLFKKYGKKMGYNSHKQFSPTKENENDYEYSSQIIPIYKSKNRTLFIISFHLDWSDYISYVIYSLNRKTLESEYAIYKILYDSDARYFLHIDTSNSDDITASLNVRENNR